MFIITSPAFINGSLINKKYSCDGEDVNPPLVIQNTPSSAKSLVLIVDDPDAPMGTWTHWLVWNIDPKTSEIPENSVPSGADMGKNDFGNVRYNGPCPPRGTHRYFFRLYAVNTVLQLKQGTDRGVLENNLQAHIVETAELMGRYTR